MSSAFTAGTPATLSALTAALKGAALVGDATYGDEKCFAVTVGATPNFAKLHALRGQLKRAGFAVRSNLCGSTPSVLVRKAPESPHSPSTSDPSSHGMNSGSDVGGGSPFDAAQHKARVELVQETAARMRLRPLTDVDAINRVERRVLAKLAKRAHAAADEMRPAPPADVDLTACDCGGDTAHKLADFHEFRTCRCCCSCGAPDSAAVDVHATADDDDDVEPHCLTCMVEATDAMLASGWKRGSFELRPIPPSDRMLRLAPRMAAA